MALSEEEFTHYLVEATFHVLAWEKTAAELRAHAKNVEENDIILSTMLKRTALAIEELQHRFRAYDADRSLERIDTQHDEEEQLIANLFANMGKGKKNE
jgi:hypothetical protein